MQTVTESSCVMRNEDIPTGEVDGELVALDIERGQCFGMDEIGFALWSIAAQPVRVSEIVDSLTEQFDIGREQCAADVVPFVAQLVQEGLLRHLPD